MVSGSSTAPGTPRASRDDDHHDDAKHGSGDGNGKIPVSLCDHNISLSIAILFYCTMMLLDHAISPRAQRGRGASRRIRADGGHSSDSVDGMLRLYSLYCLFVQL